MAGFTLSTIRAAIGAQLAANIDKGTNIDVDGKGSPAPAVLPSRAPPGANQIARASCRERV